MILTVLQTVLATALLAKRWQSLAAGTYQTQSPPTYLPYKAFAKKFWRFLLLPCNPRQMVRCRGVSVRVRLMCRSRMYTLLRWSRQVADLDANLLGVARQSLASLGVQVAAVLLGLAVSLLLGRTLGANGLGVINLSNRLVGVLLIFGLVGVQNIITRETSIDMLNGRMDSIRDRMLSASIGNGLLSATIAACGILLAAPISVHVFDEPMLATPLRIALIAMTFQVLARVYSAGLVGMNKIWQANLADQALTYVIVATCLISFVMCSIPVTIVNVASVFAAGRIIVAATVLAFWIREFSSADTLRRPCVNVLHLWKQSLPLLVTNLSKTVTSSSELIFLGILSTTRTIGVYCVALQLASLPRMLLLVVNSALSPRIAALHASGKLRELELLLQRTTAVLATGACIMFVGYLFLGKHILSLWGPGFVEAYQVLVILSLGQLFNLTTGPTGTVLIMCGHEKLNKNVSLAAMIVSIITIIPLIKFFGILGVGLVQTFVIVFSNVVIIFVVKREIGIWITPTISSIFAQREISDE